MKGLNQRTKFYALLCLRVSQAMSLCSRDNHTLKMASTDNFPKIIDDNWKRTRLLHNLEL